MFALHAVRCWYAFGIHPLGLLIFCLPIKPWMFEWNYFQTSFFKYCDNVLNVPVKFRVGNAPLQIRPIMSWSMIVDCLARAKWKSLEPSAQNHLFSQINSFLSLINKKNLDLKLHHSYSNYIAKENKKLLRVYWKSLRRILTRINFT